MAAIAGPLVAATIVLLGAMATGLLRPAGSEMDEMETRMVFFLLLGPFLLAVLVLMFDGLSDHFYLAWRHLL